MTLELTSKEFRRLLDMVYIGNWILNSARGSDRFADYDNLQEKLFALCRREGMETLADVIYGRALPSRAYEEGGIHEAIADYEDAVFFDILAEELARRDMQAEGLSQEDEAEVNRRVEEYFDEFEQHGIDNLRVETA